MMLLIKGELMRSKFDVLFIYIMLLCYVCVLYSEKAVLSQIVLERNIMNFKKKMNQLQSNSVIKKTKQEKMEMYKEKKKQEEEQRQKEEEDKKK